MTGISNSGNLTEEEKVEKLRNHKDHLDKAKTQRDQYREQCEEAKSVFTSLDEENRNRGICFYKIISLRKHPHATYSDFSRL